MPLETICVPACASCVAAGTCGKTWEPPKLKPLRGQGTARRAVRNAAIEREAARYFRLPCDHLTTNEEQAFYAVWRKMGKAWYCEQCEAWYDRPPPRKKVPDAPEQEQIPF